MESTGLVPTLFPLGALSAAFFPANSQKKGGASSTCRTPPASQGYLLLPAGSPLISSRVSQQAHLRYDRGMDQRIRIRGARQHNLKNLDLDLPRRVLTVITGPSGSGKSSLALDTLFAEGQRRYVESLSTYAKQFLDRMEKPQVDLIEGICPSRCHRTEEPHQIEPIHGGDGHGGLRLPPSPMGPGGADLLPGLWGGGSARHGFQRQWTGSSALPDETRILVTFPLKLSERVTHALVVENLRAMGFLRVLADGELVDLGIPDPRGRLEPWGWTSPRLPGSWWWWIA